MSDVRKIVDNLEKSVLIIGPEIVLKEGRSYASYHTEKYSLKTKSYVKCYYKNDNLLQPVDETDQLSIQKDFAAFYESDFTKSELDLFRRISQIPFPLIISLNPDKTVITCLESMNVDFGFDYYLTGRKNMSTFRPTINNPYVFNLLGSCVDPQSLILTYNDLFEYLSNVLNDDIFPPAVRIMLQEAQNIVFLGVDFDKWYFQLLVKLLTKNDRKFKILRYASPDVSWHQPVKFICENNFRITFVGPDIKNFINELYYYCSTSGNLRGEPILTGGKIFNPEIFISYKRSGLSKELVSSLVAAANNFGYNIIYDQEDVKYKELIKLYMDRLGWGRYIIPVISDEYLKSEYCMYELMKINRNGDFERKVFPIALDEPELFKESGHKKYESFWRDEVNKLKGGLSQIHSTAEIRNYLKKIEEYEEFEKTIPEILRVLSTRNLMTAEFHMRDGFMSLFKAIQDEIEEDLRI
jgi:hypothetical protein